MIVNLLPRVVSRCKKHCLFNFDKVVSSLVVCSSIALEMQGIPPKGAARFLILLLPILCYPFYWSVGLVVPIALVSRAMDFYIYLVRLVSFGGIEKHIISIYWIQCAFRSILKMFLNCTVCRSVAAWFSSKGETNQNSSIFPSNEPTSTKFLPARTPQLPRF